MYFLLFTIHVRVAPASNSLNMISIGLNQYNVFGSEQLVIPSLSYPLQ